MVYRGLVVSAGGGGGYVANKLSLSEGASLDCCDYEGNIASVSHENVIIYATDGSVVSDQTLTSGFGTAICVGPDGNLWVADANGGVWKVVAGVSATFYSVPYEALVAICSDGTYLWSAGENGHAVKTTTAGVSTLYTLSGSTPEGICFDGTYLWVSDLNGAVWRVTTAGVATSYPLSGFKGQSICYFDGYVWAADYDGKVWQVTVSGVDTGDATAYPMAGSPTFNHINPGSDGNLWVTTTGPEVWYVTTAGVGTSLAMATAESAGVCEVSGSSAVVWVSSETVDQLWYVTDTAASGISVG